MSIPGIVPASIIDSTIVGHNSDKYCFLLAASVSVSKIMAVTDRLRSRDITPEIGMSLNYNYYIFGPIY
jgi:hypothetical protein